MDTFTALADPTRRHIIELLAHDGALSATEIFDEFTVSHPAISQHLKVLRDTHLVTVEKQAQRRIYKINADAIDEIEVWIQKTKKLWEERFDALDSVLEQEKKKLLSK